MRPRKMNTLVLGLFLLTSAAAESFGQTTEGSIRGYIRDEQGAVMPGVTVTATSPTVALSYSATSDQEGFYRLLNLPPGIYSVTSELTGFTTFRRDNIAVRAGLNLPLDIVMQIGGMEETVTVTAETPLLEVKEATVAVNVSGDTQRSIPLGTRRHWSEFMRFTPGVVQRDSTADNAPIFYIRGAGIVSYSTMVDGADITSAVNPWWGYAALPDLSLDDVEVQSGGMSASAPLGMGASANVVMKSGTNKFHGGAMFGYTPKSWIGNNTPGATSQSMSLTQPEFSLSGPILKDRMWFFGSYRRREGSLGLSRTAEQIANLEALDPSYEVFDNPNSGNILFIKTTAQINPRHHISGFYNRDNTPYSSDSPLDLTQTFRVNIGGDSFSTRLTSVWSDSVTSRVAFSWNNKDFTTHYTQTDVPSTNYYQSVFVSQGQLQGNTLLGTNLRGFGTGGATAGPSTKWTITGDVTLYRSGWLGSHELQLGVFLQPRMTRTDLVAYTNGGFAIEDRVLLDRNNTAGGNIPYHRRIFDVASGVTAEGRFSDNAFYVQDAWSPTRRLTLNLGLRVDHITRQDDLFEQELQNSIEVGPRLGVNYMLTDDARSIVRGSFMRLHEAASVNTQGAGSVTIGYRDEYDMNLDGSFETVFVRPGAAQVRPDRIFDSDYHQPFVDEWSLGYRHQFPGQVSLDVGFIHRDYRERTANVEVNGIYEGNVFTGYQDEALNEVYLVTPNTWNWPVYKALEIIAAKRTEKVELLGSYTHVFTHLAGTWQPNDPASFIQPDAFPMDRGLLTNDNRAPTRNIAYCTGLTTCNGSHEFFDHILRLNAVYRAPWEIILSGSYALQNGLWSSAILDRIAAPDLQFGPPTVTLSNGRVVSNPLATTLRFAFPTRSEGQFQLPAAHYLNMRVGRRFSLPRDMFFEVDLDIFNILNTGANQAFETDAHALFSRTYGKGTNVQPPRTFQLGLQFVF